MDADASEVDLTFCIHRRSNDVATRSVSAAWLVWTGENAKAVPPQGVVRKKPAAKTLEPL